MPNLSSTHTQPSPLGPPMGGVDLGANRSAQRAAEQALWPGELLEQFALNMMRNGQCVSSTLMQRDRRYALAQLAYAHSIDDAVLRELAGELFQHFERRQSGVQPSPSYN